MSFQVAAEAYGEFMGRYSEPLAGLFADWVEASPGRRALDVGCGPGALTALLAQRLGDDAVNAIDPSPPFVAALAHRLPGVQVEQATAEHLPFADATFDLVVASLVVHFMPDPVEGLREMARVARPGGRVAATVWDHGTHRGPLTAFWEAVQDLDPDRTGASHVGGVCPDRLLEHFEAAGFANAETDELAVTVPYASFEQWWHPYTLGVGPGGAFVAGLDAAGRADIRERCERRLPRAPFEITAVACAVRAIV